jgi:hypothetical protein
VEQKIVWLFTMGTLDYLFIHQFRYFHSVLIPDGILTQKVKLDEILLWELNILYLKRAAALGIGFILSFLVTHSQGELIN